MLPLRTLEITVLRLLRTRVTPLLYRLTLGFALYTLRCFTGRFRFYCLRLCLLLGGGYGNRLLLRGFFRNRRFLNFGFDGFGNGFNRRFLFHGFRGGLLFCAFLFCLCGSLLRRSGLFGFCSPCGFLRSTLRILRRFCLLLGLLLRTHPVLLSFCARDLNQLGFDAFERSQMILHAVLQPLHARHRFG